MLISRLVKKVVLLVFVCFMTVGCQNNNQPKEQTQSQVEKRLFWSKSEGIRVSEITIPSWTLLDATVRAEQQVLFPTKGFHAEVVTLDIVVPGLENYVCSDATPLYLVNNRVSSTDNFHIWCSERGNSAKIGKPVVEINIMARIIDVNDGHEGFIPLYKGADRVGVLNGMKCKLLVVAGAKAIFKQYTGSQTKVVTK